MKVELQKELFKRHEALLKKSKDPKVSSRNPFYLFGIECCDGWFNLLDKLMGKITKTCTNKCDYPIIFQIKQKFGGLRFYIESLKSDDNVRDEILKHIKEAEDESCQTCEICGEQGEIKNIKGWLSCVCEKHRNQL